MIKYQLNIPTRVRKQINNLPGRYRQRIQRLIAGLAIEPRPPHAKLLRSTRNRYRIRIDDYRIIYRLEDDILLVEVLKVGQKSGSEFYDDIDES
ncbi:MAG: type II toxin-antitoxin system RelE/ParE family toxin [Caldilineaceae bacterium]